MSPKITLTFITLLSLSSFQAAEAWSAEASSAFAAVASDETCSEQAEIFGADFLGKQIKSSKPDIESRAQRAIGEGLISNINYVEIGTPLTRDPIDYSRLSIVYDGRGSIREIDCF